MIGISCSFALLYVLMKSLNKHREPSSKAHRISSTVTVFLAFHSMAATYITTDSLDNTTQENMGTRNFTQSFENATTTNVSSAAYVKPFFEYNIFLTGYQLYKNGWKVIVPPGLFGNVIIILATLKMKPFNSTSLFMISLALVDLSLNCIRIPFKEIRMETTIACQVMWLFYNALPMYSNYILLFWTLERVTAVQFPLQASTWCTVKRTAIVIAATGVFSFGTSVVWPISVVSQSTKSDCRPSESTVDFIINVWRKLDALFFIFIPMVVIILSNMLIVNGLQQSTKRHQQMTSSNEARIKRERIQRNTTLTLCAVCIAFVVLHMPTAIYSCFSLSKIGRGDQQTIANWEFVNFIGIIMAELQNSMNFYLYFLTGRRYRKVTFSLLCPCRSRFNQGTKLPKRTRGTEVFSGSK